MEISPENFKSIMQELIEIGCCADEAALLLMCDTLEELGYEEGIKIFKENFLGDI